MRELNLSKLDARPSPRPAEFDHASSIHGPHHVARVIVLGQVLAQAVGADESTKRVLWAAGYLHDLARKHDGLCRSHGRWAVERKLPGLRAFFGQAGLTPAAIGIVAEVSVWHSRKKEPPRVHPAFRQISLFKDADGLDRCRLGDLDPAFLRHPESRALIEFAEKLYRKTNGHALGGDALFVRQVAQEIKLGAQWAAAR